MGKWHMFILDSIVLTGWATRIIILSSFDVVWIGLVGVVLAISLARVYSFVFDG